MDTQVGTSDSGYSPAISIKLILRGEQFTVASMGPDDAVIRDPRVVDAGPAIIRLEVDGRVTIYHVDMIRGISPERVNQPYSLVSAENEVAA